MSQDPEILQTFARSLAGRDPKTGAVYVSAMRGLIDWLATQPGGAPFRAELLTETVIRSYLEVLKTTGRAPRTRQKILAGIRRFCRWAIGQSLLQRNPTLQIEPPTVVTIAPRELTEAQRFVLKNQVELAQSPRLAAIFALGYWVGLRVSEVAALRLDQCQVNQRAGVITVLDSKGGKSRTLDLHNMARRALYEYLQTEPTHPDTRDPESGYLFTSQRAAWLRRQGQPDHLSARGIEHLWIKLKQQASQEAYALLHDIRFHDLRHDLAHRARQAGWTLEEIAVYLGHQTKDGSPAIATTARYTLPTRQQLKQQLQRLPG